MLTSLFGDLGPPRGPDGKPLATERRDAGFRATAIMESVATEVNARGQMVDRHSRDLVVSGSPAQAIREHFAATRSDLDTASSLITLLDPAGVWAPAVIKALSDAGGRPIERLHLRDRTTLRTLATIERTTLVRRHEDTLRIVHADVRAPGVENSEVPVALMERSQMTTVIVGPLQPHAIDALLAALHNAVMLPTWRCPNLLFMLPPSAVWIANKISAVAWPVRLHVHVLSESMTGASAVWNAMLGMWNQIKAQPGWEPSTTGGLQGVTDFPIKVRDLGELSTPMTIPGGAEGSASVFGRPTPGRPASSGNAESTPLTRVSRVSVDPGRARLTLAGMLALDGLLGCAVVDATSGLAIARESLGDGVDMDQSAAACAQLLRAQRQAARGMGLAEQVDEIILGAGPRQQVIRTVSRRPDLFLVVLLDKQHANLALARYQLMELERGLG
jgi:hypothetical protein